MEIKEFEPMKISLEKDYVGFEKVREGLYDTINLLKFLKELNDSGEKEKFKTLLSSGSGTIITGDTGAGKTYALHAIANEAKKLGYKIIDGSEISDDASIEEFFEKCRTEAESSPILIIFDDRRDLLGSEPKRQTEDFFGGVSLSLFDTKEAISLDKFRRQIDKIYEYENPAHIILTAAANPAIIDKQILRRLRKLIHIPNPNVKSREELWKYYLNKYGLNADSLDLQTFSYLTEGLNAGKIAEIVSDVAYRSRLNKKITNKLVIEEIIKALHGPSTTDILESEKELIKDGYHETSHLVCAVRIGLQPILISIEPTVNALGEIQVVPSSKIPEGSSKHYFANVVHAMGSTAIYEELREGGEEGRESDLRDASTNALKLYFLKNPLPGIEIKSSSINGNEPYFLHMSERKKEEMEDEVERILDTGKEMAREIIREYKNEIKEFVEDYLFPNRTLAGNEILDSFRDLGIIPGGDYDKFEKALKELGYLV